MPSGVPLAINGRRRRWVAGLRFGSDIFLGVRALVPIELEDTSDLFFTQSSQDSTHSVVFSYPKEVPVRSVALTTSDVIAG